MSAPSEPKIIADTGGLLVTDDGRRVLVIDRCTGALTTFAFVLGVITRVVGGVGLAACGRPAKWLWVSGARAAAVVIGVVAAGALFFVGDPDPAPAPANRKHRRRFR